MIGKTRSPKEGMNIDYLSSRVTTDIAADEKEKVKTVEVQKWAIAVAIVLGITLMGLRSWEGKDALSASESYLAVHNWLEILDLTRLPMELQNTLATVLIIPLGALLVAVCRNMIGFTTCGTFAPLLLALGLVLNDWKIGLVTMLLILLIGVGIRWILEPLKMLLVPRQGTIVTFVVLFMIFSVSTLHYLDPKSSYHGVLLPVVILTGLIEQLFITIEEQGKSETTKKLLGTFIVGCCCYVLLSYRELGQLLLSYPEVHCLTIAGMIGMGGYSGYRVSELFRFRYLVDSISLSQESETKGVGSPPFIVPLFKGDLGGSSDVPKEGKTASMPTTFDRTQTKVAKNISKRNCWIWPWELRDRGILGINCRNGEYILPYNPRRSYPLVDNKVLTKEIGAKNGVQFPETYGLVARFGEIKGLEQLLAGRSSFAIKPAQGSGGRGILVIVGRDGEEFETANGKRISLAQLQSHLSMILSGFYSLSGSEDVAIIEQRIVNAGGLEAIAVGGTPDIRVIVFRGVPVMAMTRLPTLASVGRANLHQGAIAARIDLVTGETGGGVYMNRIVSVHPDTGNALEGFHIPHWQEILATTIKLAHSFNLEYLGVDLVIDADHGPMVLEVNARPGLAIQIANRCGLQRRLEFVKGQPAQMLAPDRCLELIGQLSKII